MWRGNRLRYYTPTDEGLYETSVGRFGAFSSSAPREAEQTDTRLVAT